MEVIDTVEPEHPMPAWFENILALHSLKLSEAGWSGGHMSYHVLCGKCLVCMADTGYIHPRHSNWEIREYVNALSRLRTYGKCGCGKTDSPTDP